MQCLLPPAARTGALLALLAVPLDAHSTELSANGARSSAEFSLEGKAWLERRGVLKYTFDPAWPPFSEFDKESSEPPHGIDVEVVALALERAGLAAQTVPARDWREALHLVESGAVDFVTGIARSEERSRVLDFTDGYLEFAVAIITRKDGPFYTTLESLEGRVVAVPEQYVTTELLLKRYPKIRLAISPNVEVALASVSGGQADAAVENIVSAAHIISARGLTNLKISGLIPERFGLSIAVPKDHEILRNILNKALGTLSSEDRTRIVAKHVHPYIGQFEQTRRLVPWILGVATLAAVGAMWLAYSNRRLRREIQRRRAAESRLEEMNRSKDILMEIAAHDLRSPLTAVMMAADYLRMGRSEFAGQDRESVRTIVESAVRMRRLVDNMLDLGRSKRDGCMWRHDPPTSHGAVFFVDLPAA